MRTLLVTNMSCFLLKNRGVKAGKPVQPCQIGAAALQLLRAFAITPAERRGHDLRDLLHQRRAKFTANRQRGAAHQQILQLTNLLVLNQIPQFDIAVGGVMLQHLLAVLLDQRQQRQGAAAVTFGELHHARQRHAITLR